MHMHSLRPTRLVVVGEDRAGPCAQEVSASALPSSVFAACNLETAAEAGAGAGRPCLEGMRPGEWAPAQGGPAPRTGMSPAGLSSSLNWGVRCSPSCRATYMRSGKRPRCALGGVPDAGSAGCMPDLGGALLSWHGAAGWPPCLHAAIRPRLELAVVGARRSQLALQAQLMEQAGDALPGGRTGGVEREPGPHVDRRTC